MGLSAYRFVEVEWWDIVSESAWVTRETLPTPLLHISRGWLVADEAGHIVVAGCLQSAQRMRDQKEDDPQFGDVTAIPRGCIKKMRRLKVG